MFAQLIKHLNPKVKDNIRKKKEIIRRKKKSNLWAKKTS